MTKNSSAMFWEEGPGLAGLELWAKGVSVAEALLVVALSVRLVVSVGLGGGRGRGWGSRPEMGLLVGGAGLGCGVAGLGAVVLVLHPLLMRRTRLACNSSASPVVLGAFGYGYFLIALGLERWLFVRDILLSKASSTGLGSLRRSRLICVAVALLAGLTDAWRHVVSGSFGAAAGREEMERCSLLSSAAWVGPTAVPAVLAMAASVLCLRQAKERSDALLAAFAFQQYQISLEARSELRFTLKVSGALFPLLLGLLCWNLGSVVVFVPVFLVSQRWPSVDSVVVVQLGFLGLFLCPSMLIFLWRLPRELSRVERAAQVRPLALTSLSGPSKPSHPSLSAHALSQPSQHNAVQLSRLHSYHPPHNQESQQRLQALTNQWNSITVRAS